MASSRMERGTAIRRTPANSTALENPVPPSASAVLQESAARHAVHCVPRARPHETAAAALARLRAQRFTAVELVLVTGDGGRLVGVVPLQRLFGCEGNTRLEDLLDASFPRVTAATDQEAAASLALQHGVDALPVVDDAGRPLGVMPAQALMQVLRAEHVEDLHRLAGIQRETAQARHAIEEPPLRRARHRLPWLLLGLGGAALATAVMAAMERTLQANVAVAFFVPALVYLADAIGTQSEAVAVRGLSLTRAGLAPLLGGELRTGLLVGGALGALSYGPIVWAFDDPALAAAVAVSIFTAGALANGIGLLLPWTLSRLRVDPAYGSGPLATVVQDICSILVYFGALLLFSV